MLIQVNVTNKHAQVLGTPTIVCGNSDYKIQFTFDGEWNTGAAKTARFVYMNGGSVDYTDVVFTGDTVDVPILYNTRTVRVGVFEGDLHTTTPAVIPCELSIRCGTGAPVDPTPSQYDQIMVLLYTGGTQEQLDEIVSATLTRAKESGEFDGEKGEPGYTPQKGIDYFDGEKGEPGYTPQKGIDYFDGTPATHKWEGTVLTITSAAGTSSADLKGAKGEPFTYEDFTPEQLEQLRGPAGDGSGDMLANVYDPQGKRRDVFAYADARADVAIVEIRKQFAVGDTEDEISTVTNWSKATSPNGFSARQRSCCYGNGYYLIAGTSGQMAYSKDGTDWTLVTTFTSAVITGLAYGNGRFVAVDSEGNIFSVATPDGTWENVSTSSVIIESVRYVNNRFVAVGEGGYLATSTDAITWTLYATPTENSLIDSTYGDGYYIAVGHSGTILKSINLIDWQDHSITDFGDIRTTLFTGNGFVIGGQGGKIAYSADGETWNMATNNTSSSVNWIRAFAYAEKRIYAVMYISTGAGEIWVSRDGGATWAVDYSTAGRLWCVAYSNGIFFTSGDGGAIYTLDLETVWVDEEPAGGASTWYRFVSILSNGDKIIGESYRAVRSANTVTTGTFAGQVKANASGQTPGTSLLRNSLLTADDTVNPTVEGEIVWVYK